MFASQTFSMFSFNRRRILPALVIFAIGFGAAPAVRADNAAPADSAANQQMQQKIDQLEAKVVSLEAQSAADDNTTLQKIQSAADNQSKLMSAGVGLTGYDPVNGFTIASDDGNFLLHPWLLGQFRGAINDRQSVQNFNGGANPGGGTTFPQTGAGEHDGFEIHHLMIGVNGHVVSPLLQYFVMIDVPSNGGNQTLQDAYATYRCSEDSCFSVKAGQFVDPVWHESNVDDGHLAAVDRSLAGALLAGNTGLNDGAERTQGVGLMYEHECLHGEVDFTDGRDTANTPFFDVSTNGIFPRQNFGISARAEYKVIGDDKAWKGYNSLSAYGAKSDLFVLGGGLEWDEASFLDNIYVTIDGQYTTRSGISIYGAVLTDFADWSNSSLFQSAADQRIAGSYPNFGFILQASYRIKPDVEPFIRYDLAVLDSRYADILAFGNKNPGGNAGATNNNHEFTAGVNYYLYGYRAKVSADVSFLPNGSAIDAPGLGILANQLHSEWVGRLQFQLAI